MAVIAGLGAWAARAPVPVFVARGLGAGHAVAALRADPAVRVVRTPRHATVLVVAGRVPLAAVDALVTVHDQVPAPRAVAAIGVAGGLDALGLGPVHPVPDDDVAGALRRLHEAVLAGRSNPARGRAENPVRWQGVGPHGQGGEGMMGGTPYGRPMAMPPVEGRDGLALDRLALRLGPFLPGLPGGMTLRVGLQGDVLAEAALDPLDLGPGLAGELPTGTGTTHVSAATTLLAALADLCALAGLDALARRAARVASDPHPAAVAALRRLLDRPLLLGGGLRAATDGVGRFADGDDVTGRWRGWLQAAEGAAEGALESGDVPKGPAAPPLEAVGDALVGMELGRALLTVCSLQPGLEEQVWPQARTGRS